MNLPQGSLMLMPSLRPKQTKFVPNPNSNDSDSSLLFFNVHLHFS